MAGTWQGRKKQEPPHIREAALFQFEASLLGAYDHYLPAWCDCGSIFYPDLNVASQRIEESKQPVAGKSRDATSDQFGHFRLIDAENLCDFILAEPFFLDQLDDLFRQLGAHQRFFRVTNSYVRKDIPTSLLKFNIFAHFFSFFVVRFLANSPRSDPIRGGLERCG